MRVFFNDDWKFSEVFEQDMLLADYNTKDMLDVRLPHTVKELPFHYFDESMYQMVSGYRKVFTADKAWKDKAVLLTIDGAAHDSEVYLNGEKLGEHHCGYTAFTVDISDYVSYDKDNVLVVKVDSREELNVPPFGFVVDYMTYGGIYRDVYIDVKEKSYIDDVFVTTKLAGQVIEFGEDSSKMFCEKSAIIAEVTVKNRKEGMFFRQFFRKKGEEAFTQIDNQGDLSDHLSDAGKNEDVETLVCHTGKVELWDVEQPSLYELKTELMENGKVVDESIVTFGYRKAIFKKDGFYLNGRKLKIRGLNRHQSYPYVGYAMPKSMQQLDADILKNELGVNAVRTSHYPQSHYFIDRCDEIGLLVFTEFPGWQHIGDENWKAQAVDNVADMIKQYRNHTSIILWGVRINESVDDHDFYIRTNTVAHAFDHTRQTGGVRCYKKGDFLEDVFTYNDFLHDGKRKGCDKKSDVTSDVERPYLISEYNGHMYPTKSFDWEEHRAQHAIRHANVLDEVAKQTDISGSFGWCMFDYNTHKDFGSGDRICYHGVMDMFRNPKMAASVYASQQDATPVIELSSSMDIGEHPGCNRGDTWIFTNADSVKMYKNGEFIKEYTKENSPYKNLSHPPILIDDFIGDTLEKGENMGHRQAEDVKALLNEVAKVGLYGLSKLMYAKAGKLMVMYHMKMEDAVALYNKYVGDWGGESTEYKFEAIKDGEVVKTLVKKPMTKVCIEALIDHDKLVEENSYDVAAVRINARDEFGNILPFFNDPISLSIEGPCEIIGPKVLALQGGMGGTYIKTTGKKGAGKLTISCGQAEDVEIKYNVEM
ncbi:MAG: glycoside hydrolase family 2 protein [Lachnospiraceae bacterium]|nr:glycoside hydrolase family 2 protein [Lachnospiraceae bacterium]